MKFEKGVHLTSQPASRPAHVSAVRACSRPLPRPSQLLTPNTLCTQPDSPDDCEIP